MKGDSAAAEEQHGDEGLWAVEAEGAPGDHAQAIVEPFDDAVGETVADVGEDAVTMLADGASGADEGAQPRSRCPGEPLAQSPLGALGLDVVERPGERFFEQVGAVEGAVVSLDLAQLLPLAPREIPGIAEKREATALQGASLRGIVELAHLLAAHGIDGVGRQALDVEAIEDDPAPS